MGGLFTQDPFGAVNCSHHVDEVPAYFAISGTGAMVGYIGAAGLTLLTTLLQYLCTHDPRQMSSRNQSVQDEEVDEPRANPVDVIILRRLRSLAQKIRCWQKPSRGPENGFYKFEDFLYKFTRVTSDLQILAGISLLISAYARLQTGLQNFHWVLVAHLAYFCALSNQSYLTSLRSNRRSQTGNAAWRLPVIGAFTALLLTSTVLSLNASYPTLHWPPRSGHSSYDPEPGPGDFAACSLTPRGNFGYDNIDIVLTVLLIAFGTFVRIIRLYAVLPQFRERLRGLGREVRYKILSFLNGHGHSQSSVKLFGRLILYRPILAILLVSGFALDLVSSMFFDWVWLFCAFWKGIDKIGFSRSGAYLTKDEWTFGQILPLVLLAAPLIVSVERNFNTTASTTPQEDLIQVGETSTHITTEETDSSSTIVFTPHALQPPHLLSDHHVINNPGSLIDDPELQFTRDAAWLPLLVFLACVEMFMWSFNLIKHPRWIGLQYPAPAGMVLKNMLRHLPQLEMARLALFVAFAILIDSLETRRTSDPDVDTSESLQATERKRVIAKILHVLNFFAAFPATSALFYFSYGTVAATIYLSCCIVLVARHWVKSLLERRANREETASETGGEHHQTEYHD